MSICQPDLWDNWNLAWSLELDPATVPDSVPDSVPVLKVPIGLYAAKRHVP